MSKRLTTEEFVERANKVHGDKYDYSDVIYVNAKTKVKIKCKIHGIFEQTPNRHYHQKCGCPKCAIENKILSTKEFVDRAQKLHKNRYTYDNTRYTRNTTPSAITCKRHGDFNQSPHSHLKGQGCPKCAIHAKSMTTDEFIDKAKTIHKNTYDYTKVNYVNKRTHVCIICSTHGDFWQLPYVHTKGCGCPKCKRSLGEEYISAFLSNNNIIYESEKRFNTCKFDHPLLFDFYIESINICIEFDGRQHYDPIPYFGGDEFLVKQQHRDKIKDAYCIEHNIRLLRIPYTELNNIEYILKEQLISH